MVCASVVATPNDQSHAMIVPGAVDVPPLDGYLSELPMFVSVEVSVSVGSVTPKLAVATIGRANESATNAVAAGNYSAV